MPAFVSSHRHRIVPIVLSVLFVIASAAGTWAVLPAKAAPAVPTVATAGELPEIVRPTPRTPGALVIPKKKVKKAAAVVRSAPVVTNTASTGTSSTYTAPVTRTATHTAAKKSSSAGTTADAEFGPG
ncbi:MAG: hypothetical protein AAGC46_12805 [Solirubrobacteraceae bacterium]|nr:hypothetical protein [Patulibacter sp.]